MGEVAQIAAKLVSTDGEDRYWDGTDLREELCCEIGDLLAVVAFVSNENHLDTALIQARMGNKLTKFETWHKGNKK
jgi:NTP pyrophosphatase (non-canonical NTP hydrolase)